MEIPKHIPQFDYLRGVAVLMVMLFHASHDVQAFPMGQYLSLGWAGVDLFFVLSGFLITGILLDTRDQKGYFANFYARRALRIWPLYFVLLGVMFFAVPILLPSWGAAAMQNAKPAWAFVLFVQNLFIGPRLSGPLAPTWSLAIEEQFYFVWPVLVWILPRKGVQRFAVALVLCSPLLRLVLYLGHVQISMYYNTLTRLDGLAVGSFLSIWLRDTKTITVKRWALVALAISSVGVVLLHQLWISYSALAITSGALVSLSLFATFKNRFILFTGRISYGLYLIHMGVFGIATKPELRRFYPKLPVLNDVAYLAVGALLTYGAASLSWFLLEKQVLYAKRWFAAPTASTSTERPEAGEALESVHAVSEPQMQIERRLPIRS